MAAASKHETWTTRRLLGWTAEYFEAKGIDSPRVSAEMLLSHVLGCKRLKLYMDADRPATELERAAFRELVERAAKHEPVDYLVGQAPFFSMMFKVTPDVLIPRPSTETIVEHVIQHARRTPGYASPVIADVGTGSGCIAIALAKQLDDARVIATDISDPALEIAKENASTHGVADRIDFRHGDLLQPLHDGGQRFHFLISNPPYIPDDEWETVAPNVKDHEPTSALRGGVDGMDFIRPIIEGASQLMHHPGQLLIEVAASRSKEVLAFANDTKGFVNAAILADHDALPRVLVADRQ